MTPSLFSVHNSLHYWYMSVALAIEITLVVLIITIIWLWQCSRKMFNWQCDVGSKQIVKQRLIYLPQGLQRHFVYDSLLLLWILRVCPISEQLSISLFQGESTRAFLPCWRKVFLQTWLLESYLSSYNSLKASSADS